MEEVALSCLVILEVTTNDKGWEITWQRNLLTIFIDNELILHFTSYWYLQYTSWKRWSMVCEK